MSLILDFRYIGCSSHLNRMYVCKNNVVGELNPIFLLFEFKDKTPKLLYFIINECLTYADIYFEYNSLDKETTICRRRAGLPVMEVRWCGSVWMYTVQHIQQEYLLPIYLILLIKIIETTTTNSMAFINTSTNNFGRKANFDSWNVWLWSTRSVGI